jgi:hypothetical protein
MMEGLWQTVVWTGLVMAGWAGFAVAVTIKGYRQGWR